MSDDGKRAETGPMQFGDDWTGVFIRGDNACAMAMQLKSVLDCAERGVGPDPMTLAMARGLLSDLACADERGVRDGLQRLRPFRECLVRAEAPTTPRPAEEIDVLTPVAGGHVFRGTWEALAALDTATCAACGEYIKDDGAPADVVEHDGAGVPHRIMCEGWGTSTEADVLPSLTRGIVRQRQAPDDVGDLLPSRPSHEARVELYSAHWDASRAVLDDPLADAKAPLFRIGQAFESLCAALSDEEQALRLALEHDERVKGPHRGDAAVERSRAEGAAEERARVEELGKVVRDALERLYRLRDVALDVELGRKRT